VLIQDDQVVCLSSFRWIKEHKMFEHTLVATDFLLRRCGCGRVIQAYVSLLAKRCGCDIVALHADIKAIPFWEQCQFITLPEMPTSMKNTCTQVMSRAMKHTVPHGRIIANTSEAELIQDLLQAHDHMMRAVQYRKDNPDSSVPNVLEKSSRKIMSPGLGEMEAPVYQGRQKRDVSKQNRKCAIDRDEAVGVGLAPKRSKTSKQISHSPDSSTSTVHQDDESIIRSEFDGARLPHEVDSLQFSHFWNPATRWCVSLSTCNPLNISARALLGTLAHENNTSVSSTKKQLALLHLARAQKHCSLVQ